jgi:hypothetical protein
MRVGRTLTHHFEIETRQYDLLGSTWVKAPGAG